jgi:hypothetical protein
MPSEVASVDNVFTTFHSSRRSTASVSSSLPKLLQIEIQNYYMPIPLLVKIVSECAQLFGSTLDEFKVSVMLQDLELEHERIIKHASMFRQFKKLRVLRITLRGGSPYPRSRVDVFRTKTALPFIHELVNQCPTLEEVQIHRLPIYWEHTWLITGTSDNRDGHCPSDDCDAHILYVPNPPTLSSSCASTA